jgi:hypothetical protein
MLDLGTASPLDIAAGERREGISIRLRREHVFSVRGKATLNGEPAPSAAILEWSPVGGGPITGLSRLVRIQNGSFQIENLLPGAYELEVSGRTAGSPGLSGRVEFTVKDANLDNTLLSLRPGVEVSGVFRVEEGFGKLASPISATRIGLQNPDEGLFPSVNAKTDGAFKLPPLAIGQYLLNVNGLPQGTYIKSVRYGSKDVTRSLIELSESGEALEIVLSVKAATLAGSVRNDNGDPIPGVMVTAWPKNLNPGTVTGGIASVYSDQDGTFTIGGLEPGEYSVAAWDEMEPTLTQVPAFRAAFASQAERAKVDEGAQVSVTVKMIPKDRIAIEAAKIP